MDKKVYIIHSSIIMQQGLTEIIRKNFRSVAITYYSFEEFLASEKSISEKSILIIEEKISVEESYLHFIQDYRNVLQYIITAAKEQSEVDIESHCICLFDSADDIYEKLKPAFRQSEPVLDKKEGLTKRETEVLVMVARGLSNKEIADELFISIYTVMSHRKNITEKLGIKSISGLTVYAIINNYLDTSEIDPDGLI